MRLLCLDFFFFFLQRLSGSHKALVEMQDDVAELLRSATRDFASTKVRVCVCVCDDLNVPGQKGFILCMCVCTCLDAHKGRYLQCI